MCRLHKWLILNGFFNLLFQKEGETNIVPDFPIFSHEVHYLDKTWHGVLDKKSGICFILLLQPQAHFSNTLSFHIPTITEEKIVTVEGSTCFVWLLLTYSYKRVFSWVVFASLNYQIRNADCRFITERWKSHSLMHQNLGSAWRPCSHDKDYREMLFLVLSLTSVKNSLSLLGLDPF